jgi:hypothetical protein
MTRHIIRLSERASSSVGPNRVIAVINDRWRVIDAPLQWILEVRKGRTSSKATG